MIYLNLLFLSLLQGISPATDSLNAALQAFSERSNLPGFAVSIVRADGVLYQAAYGYADKENETAFTENTLQNVGSVSKTLVGVAVVKLIEEGKLTMDTPVNDVLPFAVINPHYEDDPITIRHLVTHTSSIHDSDYYGHAYLLSTPEVPGHDIHEGFYEFASKHEDIELEEFLYRILAKDGDWYSKRNYLKKKPGSENEYSNLNAALAALVVESVSGRSFIDYTETTILQPLNMEYSGWRLSDVNVSQHAVLYFPEGTRVPRYRLITYPDGGFISNVTDLSAYVVEMIKGYVGEGSLLSDESFRLLLPGDDDENRAFWGMGSKSRNIGHQGSDPGVHADIQFNADSKTGFVVITNTNVEDDDDLWQEYRELFAILKKYAVTL